MNIDFKTFSLVGSLLTVACFPPMIDFADTSGTGDGDGDNGTMGDGDGDGPCSFPLAPCPNNDCDANGRRNLSDMDCGLGGCSGLWSGTYRWSHLLTADILEMSPPTDPSTIWDCEPNPDVDLCTDIDANGLAECYRIDGEFTVAVQPACVSDGTSVDIGNGMCSSTPETIAFVEVRCSDAGLVCAGRPVDSVDAWVPVASEASLNQLLSDSTAEPLAAWSDGCAAGQVPSMFMPKRRCMWLNDEATSVCYVGDGRWWTQVDRCVATGVDPAWPETQCNGEAGMIGQHPWDAVTCEGSTCVGRFSEDIMRVSPTCRFVTWNQVEP